jgi:hypothetical protein
LEAVGCSTAGNRAQCSTSWLSLYRNRLLGRSRRWLIVIATDGDWCVVVIIIIIIAIYEIDNLAVIKITSTSLLVGEPLNLMSSLDVWRTFTNTSGLCSAYKLEN